MDLLTIGGLALELFAVVGGQLFEGGSLGSIIQFPPLVIVTGGTLAAVLIQSARCAWRNGWCCRQHSTAPR